MLLTVHDYWQYHNRYELVNSWWKERKEGDFREELIPPVAVIVEADGEPVAFLSMYLAVGIGIAFLEWPVTKPCLGVKAKAPMIRAIEALAEVAKSHDYGLLRIATLPKIARFLKREGWILEDEEIRIPLMRKL